MLKLQQEKYCACIIPKLSTQLFFLFFYFSTQKLRIQKFLLLSNSQITNKKGIINFEITPLFIVNFNNCHTIQIAIIFQNSNTNPSRRKVTWEEREKRKKRSYSYHYILTATHKGSTRTSPGPMLQKMQIAGSFKSGSSSLSSFPTTHLTFLQ